VDIIFKAFKCFGLTAQTVCLSLPGDCDGPEMILERGVARRASTALVSALGAVVLDQYVAAVVQSWMASPQFLWSQ
jgi:hypothetical protein